MKDWNRAKEMGFHIYIVLYFDCHISVITYGDVYIFLAGLHRQVWEGQGAIFRREAPVWE